MMNSKKLALSFAGLKNIISCNNSNTFRFIFGKYEIQTNNFNAEFISPTVVDLHQNDVTIDKIDYSNINEINQCLTEEVVNLFKDLLCGKSIEINENQCYQLRIISMLIGNVELLNAINELFPISINNSNIKEIVQYLTTFESISRVANNFDYQSFVDDVAGYLYLFDENTLLSLPFQVLLAIVSSNNLKVDEDFLLHLFIQFIDQNEESFELLEHIDFLALSDDVFHEFISQYNGNQMTAQLWRNISARLLATPEEIKECIMRKANPNIVKCDYNKNDPQNSRFKGIIHYLTEKGGGDVITTGKVDVKPSSVYTNYNIHSIVELHNEDSYFATLDNGLNTYIEYDFKENKIHPTYYSLRSRPDGGKGSWNMKYWIIEGSNTGNNDWKTLDERSNIESLDDIKKSETFNIREKLEPNEFFRYIRIKLNGVDSHNNHYIVLSAIEFFGYLI